MSELIEEKFCVECQRMRPIINNSACGSDECCGPNYDLCCECGGTEFDSEKTTKARLLGKKASDLL